MSLPDTASDYLTFDEAAAYVCMSRGRVEQLLRQPSLRFPSPFQPSGRGGRRVFVRTELADWMERRRASYRAPRRGAK